MDNDAKNDGDEEQDLQQPQETAQKVDLLLLLALLSRRSGRPASTDVSLEERHDGFDERNETDEEENLQRRRCQSLELVSDSVERGRTCSTVKSVFEYDPFASIARTT